MPTQERRTTVDHPAIHQSTPPPRIQPAAPDDVWDDEDEEDQEAGHHIASVVRRYNGIPMPDGMLFPGTKQHYYVHHGPPPLQQTSDHARRAATDTSFRDRPRRRVHWTLWIGLAFLIMLGGYVGLGALGSWWQLHSDDSTYGRPRTFQVDAVVGHHDSASHPSHFIALNLSRHIVIVEIPGGDASQSMIYGGPTLLGEGQDLIPVTLTFRDENGDGHPDMLVHILDQTLIFLNTGSKFVSSSQTVSSGGMASPFGGGVQ